MRKHFLVILGHSCGRRALHAALRRGLPLPPDYGDNLDAWHDVLTEFGGRWSVVFRGRGSRRFRKVCRDAVRETPGLFIRFTRA